MMEETEVNTSFAQFVNYHIPKFVMNYILLNYFQISKFSHASLIMTSFVKFVLPKIFIIRKFSCFFYDTMISYYLLNCHAYYERYCKYYSHEKR